MYTFIYNSMTLCHWVTQEMQHVRQVKQTRSLQNTFTRDVSFVLFQLLVNYELLKIIFDNELSSILTR